jgi:integrase
MATGHLEKRSKRGWTIVIDHGRYVDPVTKKERQRREYRALKNCTKAEALALLHDTLAKINAGAYVKPSSVTLETHLRRWYKERCEPRLAPATLQNYAVCLNKHLIPALGDRPLGELQPLDLQRFYSDMLAAGAHPRTVEQVHQVLHIALAQAVKWGLVVRNVADLADPPRPPKRRIAAVSPQDIDRVITSAPPLLRDIIELTVRTGLRRGEVLALSWRQVDLERRILSVDRNLQRINGRYIIKQPKTERSIRAVPLDEGATALLGRRKRSNPGELVFSREDGSPLDPSWLTHAFRKLSRGLALDMRFHDLRHAYAGLALMAGVDMRVLRELMGHEDISTTVNTYTHVLETVKARAARAIGDLLDTGKRQTSDGSGNPGRGETGF